MMASTIEPCESKPAGLATLSSTLEMFDTFKPSQDEDRDSDEESFHLPMLGCDDDLDISNKETSGLATPNPETEDDILNKFETTATPDIDPKLEESILNDDNEETCERGPTNFVETNNMENNSEKSNVSAGCVEEMKKEDNKTEADGEEKTIETPLSENNCVDSGLSKDIKTIERKDTSETDENTDGSGIFKDLEIVDELDDSLEEKSGEKDNEKINDKCKKNVVEMNGESETMEVDEVKAAEESPIQNIQDNVETSGAKDDLDDSEDIDDTSLANKKSGASEEITENVAETVSVDKNSETIKPDNSLLNEDLSSTDKGITDKVNDENIPENISQIENNQEENRVETLTEETKMKCDDDEDDLINDIVKEVNEKLDSDEDEMMEDNPVLQECSTNQMTSTNTSMVDGNNDKMEDCAELEEINSSSCSNTAVQNLVEEQDNATPKSSDQDQVSDVSKPKAIDSISKNTGETIDSSNDLHERGNEENEINECGDNAEPMDIDISVGEEENIPASNSQKLGLGEIEDNSEREIIDHSKSTTADILENLSTTENVEIIPAAEIEENMPTAEIMENTPTAEVLENTPTAEIVENTPTAEIVENTPTAEIVDNTPTAEIVENKLVQPTTECTESVPRKDIPNEENKTEPSKTETVFDSTSLECDDLLDVSIIRDVDEDNATAIAENDIQSSEKSDNDDQDDDKADNEMDESEADQDDILLSSDKDYRIDSEEGNSNSCDQDTTTTDNLISENTSDGETKDDVVMKETEESKDSPSSPKMENENDSMSEKPATEAILAEIGNREKIKENGVQLGKRPFSESGNGENQTSKKLRLSSDSDFEEKGKIPIKSSQMKTLITFEKFMQDRKFGSKKLTRSDLEQFCLQKICEAIVHKTDVGELHQTVKKQESIIENLRKDLQQLTKQTRDLDIVNKKLMNELKLQNGNKKPLVPLKITRSVGLQVKLNIGLEAAARRKQPAVPTTPVRTPSTPSTTTTVNRSRNITPANAGVVRQVNQNSTPVTTTTPLPSPRKQQPTTPLLSQALQTRQTPPIAKRPPLRPKPVEPAKGANPGVIDLTDEDDKTSKTVGTPLKIPNKPTPSKPVNIAPNKNPANKTVNSQPNKVAAQANKVAGQANKMAGQANKVMNKANKPLNNQGKPVTMAQVKAVASKAGTQTRTVATLPQGVRLTSTQLKNGLTIPANVVTSNASGTTQFMYVVQPSSLTSTAGGTQKAVLLNFQPTNNGVLASTINGSAVSVIPSKTPNTMQLKTITTPRKHPASLPLPPSVPQNPSLKPLLPKPHLSIRKTDTGIILQWRMPYNLDIYEGIASYQLFAYQETNAPPSTDMWRKVGDVKALALPMACTLTQFADKNKYYFAVRSVDVHKRIGAFSDPEEISL